MSDYLDLRMAARSWGDFFARSSGFKDGPLDFVGVVIGAGVLEDVVTAEVGGGLLGCGFLLNLRDFKSEALVLGNCAAVCFDNEAKGFSLVSLRFWFTAGVSGMPLIRRFFGRWRPLVLSDIDVADAGVDREGGRPETFGCLSIPDMRKKTERKSCHVDVRIPLEVLLIP